MFRNIGGVIAGLVVGSMANMALIILNTSVLFPMPPGVDMNNAEQFSAYLADLPALAFVVALLAHLSQAGIGGWVAARIGATRPVTLALIVGCLTALGSAINMANLGGPPWMWIDVPLCVALGWGVGTLEQRRRDGLSPAV